MCLYYSYIPMMLAAVFERDVLHFVAPTAGAGPESITLHTPHEYLPSEPLVETGEGGIAGNAEPG